MLCKMGFLQDVVQVKISSAYMPHVKKIFLVRNTLWRNKIQERLTFLFNVNTPKTLKTAFPGNKDEQENQ